MKITTQVESITAQYVSSGHHRDNHYFSALSRLVALKKASSGANDQATVTQAIQDIYAKVEAELKENTTAPTKKIQFGTSGWRGMLGKELNIHTVAAVTAAIISMYHDAADHSELASALGIANFAEFQQRGCVIGFDNRFGGRLMAQSAVNVLLASQVKVYYADEATTGSLSASVLIHQAACSINLTPSHNPFEYGGFKYNGADAGPAAPILTNLITKRANEIVANGHPDLLPSGLDLSAPLGTRPNIESEDALASWQALIKQGQNKHGLDYMAILQTLKNRQDIALVVDCIHGASRIHVATLLDQPDNLVILRGDADVTFGGIAPEPSSANMAPVLSALAKRSEPLKLGAIIDPDADRIRFTDGKKEISMNQFGAMAYHFLHEHKGKKGMVAKTVATSNLANGLAAQLGETVFEPKVGFKEFKPVIDKALVFFEESDGISVIGHTPEKDAYIGLILALDMVLSLNKNLGDYLDDIEKQVGGYFPDRDGIPVSRQGEALLSALSALDQYQVGATMEIGTTQKTIKEILTIDGWKMIFEDNSWLMIRPSGTEPKVRFYVEARDPAKTAELTTAAKSLLVKIGLLT